MLRRTVFNHEGATSSGFFHCTQLFFFLFPTMPSDVLLSTFAIMIRLSAFAIMITLRMSCVVFPWIFSLWGSLAPTAGFHKNTSLMC